MNRLSTSPKLLAMLLAIGILGCDPAKDSPSAGDRSGRPTSKERMVDPVEKPVAKDEPREAGQTEQPKDPATRREMEEPKEVPPEKAPPIPESYKPLNKGKTIFFEKTEDGTRRVHLLAEVCLREGQLEVLLCKAMTKEHEAILRIDADARDIHMALIAAGAKPGSPVKYVPKYTPANGTPIKITLTYRMQGKVVTVPATDWVRDIKTKKPLGHEWVFAGSKFFQDPEDPKAPPYYCANNGEVISLSNFPDSMLDLPVNSPKDASELIFEINTSSVPPQLSPVLITLEPVIEKK
jgi:hypothetical protein